MAITIQQAGWSINPGDDIRVNFFLYDAPQVGIFGVDYHVDSIGGTPTAGQVALGMYGHVTAALQVLVAIPCLFLGVKVTSRTLSAVRLPGIATGTDVGSDGPNSGPKQASGIIHIATDRAGPSGRGRCYVPFPSVAAPDVDGTPTTTYVVALNALADDLFNIAGIGQGADNISASQQVYHRLTSTATLSFVGVGKKLFATQKRRGDYGRVNAAIIS
jgi:hypothetical protein